MTNLNVENNNNHTTKSMYIDFWNKYNLSVEEASAYFHIGENRLRAILAENPRADFILKVGSRTLVKKNKFGKFLDEQYEI